MENRIISILIGLIGACGNNPKTENTDRLAIKSLALAPCCSNCNNRAIQNIIDEIRAEKNRIVPGCTLCTASCGNTSDLI